MEETSFSSSLTKLMINSRVIVFKITMIQEKC